MKAVVSGASGYLGSKLVLELANRGFDHVCGLILEPEILALRLEEYADILCFSFVSSVDWEATKEALEDADVLIHCAFPRAQAAAHLAAGLKYGNDLFVAARDAGCKAVINISSQSVYDSHRDYAATEDSPLVLDSTYAAGKYASELMLDDVYAGLPHTSVRLASLIGPGFDQRVPNKMVKRALAGEVITVQGGNQVFDYMDVRDAVDALCTLAASDPCSWQPVFNVGSMQPVTLLDIATLIQNTLLRRNIPAVSIDRIDGQSELTQNSSLDSSALSRTINWRPCYTIDDSICAIVINFLDSISEPHGSTG